jgi:Amt family ammonium transporter
MSPADLLFMLVSAALVMIMTPGLALFYGGLVGKRNAISIIFHLFLVRLILFLDGFMDLVNISSLTT